MRIAVTTQRMIVRLINGGLSNHAIGRQLSLSHNTVGVVRRRLDITGLTHTELASLDDQTFVLKLGTSNKRPHSKKIQPDWSVVQDEVQQKDVTLALVWEEYRLAYAENLDSCFSYSQFQRRFKGWLKKQRISMRQFHRPGEKLFVDFCGRTMPVTDPDTGAITPHHVFVGVLGGSSYSFVYAVPSQKISDWIECHVQAFEFFGGVPLQVVSDNLKSAIQKHTRTTVLSNPAYAHMTEHYDVLINPARPHKPRDKPLAEVGVQIVQRWVLAPLRNRTFFSTEELNVALAERNALLNGKISKKYKQSRADRFEQIEPPRLSRRLFG